MKPPCQELEGIFVCVYGDKRRCPKDHCPWLECAPEPDDLFDLQLETRHERLDQEQWYEED